MFQTERRTDRKSDRRSDRRPQRKRVCQFCVDKVEPNYKEFDRIRRFMTERGKIISRSRTGNCEKHQRRLARSIKQARYMALVPFSVSV